MTPTSACGGLAGKPAPALARSSARGATAIHDPSGQVPHVLVFAPSLTMRGAREYLDAIALDWEEYDRLGAEVLAITLRDAPPDLPIGVISHARDLFTSFGMLDAHGEPQPGVVVVDRYGQVEACFSAESFAGLPREPEVAQRLASAESQCPECGVPEERWLDVA